MLYLDSLVMDVVNLASLAATPAADMQEILGSGWVLFTAAGGR